MLNAKYINYSISYFIYKEEKLKLTQSKDSYYYDPKAQYDLPLKKRKISFWVGTEKGAYLLIFGR